MMKPFQRTMQAHLQGVEIRIGSVTLTVQETFLDRVFRVFSPARADQRLAARGAALALQRGNETSTAPPGRRTISRGYSPPPKMGSGPYAEGGRTFDNLVDNYQAGMKCSRGKAIRAVAADHPEAHERYLRELNG